MIYTTVSLISHTHNTITNDIELLADILEDDFDRLILSIRRFARSCCCGNEYV